MPVATVATKIFFAPPFNKVLVHSAAVLPVVNISSTSSTRAPLSLTALPSEKPKAPLRFASLSLWERAGVRVVPVPLTAVLGSGLG
jgi:hypothetical protein